VRIVLTRPHGREEELTRRLEQLGHSTVHCPLIAPEPLGDDPVDVAGYDWVVLTSVNGARELRRRARGAMPRVAAIGKATAEAFGGADLVPRVSTQEGLLAELPRPAGRVLFAGAEGARRLLVDELGADFLALYRTRRLHPAALPEGDLAVLMSASAARALGELRRDLPAVTIGPETTRAARAAGVQVLAEAATHDVEGVVSAVESLQAQR
jgi:uroporphyrinogen-III synthase/uroporphyrinogen III methyltransferase/synthase